MYYYRDIDKPRYFFTDLIAYMMATCDENSNNKRTETAELGTENLENSTDKYLTMVNGKQYADAL